MEPSVGKLPGSNSRQWLELHRGNAAPSTHPYDFVWDATSEAIGPFCKDPDGNVFLDFTAHVGAAPLGYNNPMLMEEAQDWDIADPLKMAGQDFYLATGKHPNDTSWPSPANLMDLLTDVSSQYNLDTVFLTNSGAEAVENGIKICYDYRESMKHGIAFEGAFHGRTLGALSVSKSKSSHSAGFPEIAGIREIPFSEQGVNLLAEKLDNNGGHLGTDEIAFVIIEPIQGEGGYNFASTGFLAELGRLCNENDIPVIVDEVQSGLGRTGEFWAIDHYELEPDVLVSAKGLRVGATISRSEVFPDSKNRISSTWGAGDLLGSALGALTIRVIQDENLMDHAAELGDLLLDRLREIKSRHDAVNDVRGIGLMAAVELQSKTQQQQTIDQAFRNGFLTLGCGTKSIRLLPPLDVTEREIELAVDQLDKVLSAM